MNSSEKEKNHRILAIDDEQDVLEFLKIYLESLGWEVTTTSSVGTAFKALDEGHFFLIVTDIAMPDMDGYEFVSRIREKGIDSRVVLMTGFGYNPRHTLIKINKSLNYPCLFKPFDRTKLADTVLKAWQEYNNDHESLRATPVPGGTAPQSE